MRPDGTNKQGLRDLSRMRPHKPTPTPSLNLASAAASAVANLTSAQVDLDRAGRALASVIATLGPGSVFGPVLDACAAAKEACEVALARAVDAEKRLP